MNYELSPIQWRAIIGALYPADGYARDAEHFMPPGTTLHATLTSAPEGAITIEKIEAMAEDNDLENAACLLARVPLDSIAYFCTAASFIGGPGSDLKIVKKLQEVTGVPATTTSTAMLKALQVLDINRVAIVAPYPKPVTERLIDFLAGNSIEVVQWKTFNCEFASRFQSITAGDVYRLATEANHSQAQGIFISCTGMPTIDVIDPLEQDLRKPVLSANQVTIWHSLLLAGIRNPMKGLGKLFIEF